MSQLTIALGRYEELILYSTPCGEYVEHDFICNNCNCRDINDCFAGENLLDEIGVQH